MPHTHEHLKGKELLLRTFAHEKLEQVPWVPFAGVHAGSLVGYSALDVLTHEKMLLESLLRANQIYDPDGQPVLFDLQVEAEILGCSLAWAQDAPPSVVTHPLGDLSLQGGGLETRPTTSPLLSGEGVGGEVPLRLPEKTDGRLPMILRVMAEMKRQVGEKTALYGLVTGPLTLASHLRGTEFFMDIYDNPEFAAQLIDFCQQVCLRVAGFYVEAGMDVIAVVDPVVSQVSPRTFRSLLLEPFRQVFAGIRQMGALSSFFVCGDATKNIEVMCQTAPDSISVDENIDLVAAKAITDRYNIVMCGNIPLTTRMLLGTQQDNMKFVVDLLDKVGRGNFILSPGCDMPYATPAENVVGALQAVRDPENTKVMLAHYQARTFDYEVTLPDYAHLTRPLVEVFTLDSATCAACGYMLSAATRAVAEFGGQVDMVEYKFTRPENVARVVKMGIQKLPSLFINGQLKYSSVIPSNRELLDEIRKVLR